MIFNWKKFWIGLLIIFIDLAIYIFLGLVILGYEDFYDESKGESWSLTSMTFGQKAAYIGWYIWLGINGIAILYVVFRFIKQIKEKYFDKN